MEQDRFMKNPTSNDMHPICNLLRAGFLLFLTMPLLTLVCLGQKPKKSTEPQPSAFAENKMWEFKVSDPVRSSHQFKVISPVSGASYSDSQILFQWQGTVPKNLYLGVVNNRNKEVLYQEISGEKFSLSAKKTGLKPGLYYWFMETDQEMICLGKFIYRPAVKKKP